MVVLALFVKPIAWFVVFRLSMKGTLEGMLFWATGVALFLTLVDKVSVAENLGGSAILLTLVLYVMLSFMLLPVAWKIQNPVLRLVLNLVGTLGAFAGVNFMMDFLRSIMPHFSR